MAYITRDKPAYTSVKAHTKLVLDQVVYGWQLEIGAAALCRDDVIVDVGTGSGKTLSFSIPLVLNETDIALRVTPLTALMIDQAASSNLRTVAICSETLESLWGGSFRLDYAALGVLRGHLPRHVPFIVASATLPDHILDDICTKLQLSAKAKVRVILWGLPPSFCALVQRAGHAARDFKMLGEAILIVPPTVLSKGITETEVESALTINVADESTEAENIGEEETEILDGGVRVAHNSNDEGDAEVK
ncbi:hypothetical protein PILCRDRAFT_90341 [Piloderma croceum F 1598]|uniref:DEAD/DEAH-box helicase domain-containing protein n=1 Tax=Piloderma croceum (strain F 1598) TaxID=765440 RepID=A0A0C3BNY5_PILCF|nr:hypothetical protein PILCRDRAFT_90341 [Piloderma croceum F 1598]